MKTFIVYILLSIVSFDSFSQPFINRSTLSNTNIDGRLGALKNFILPRYKDTTEANLTSSNITLNNLGLDSCAAIIYTRSDNKIWKRTCPPGPKAWVEVGGGTVTGAINGLTLFGSNIGLGGTLNQNTLINGASFAFNMQSLSDFTIHSDAGSTTRLKLSTTSSNLFSPNGINGFKIQDDSLYAIGITKGNTTDSILTYNKSSNSVGYVSASSFGAGSLPPEMDVFLIGGQSNAVGNSGAGGAALSPNPDSATVYQYYLSAFTMVTDEVGPANTGSAWPSFGITWFNRTGRKIAFVPTAVNGTGQLATSDSGFGNWSPTGTLYGTSLSSLSAAIASITAAGYTPVFRGILWSQGENDANFINSAAITQSDYQTGLTNMIADYRTALGENTPFYIFRTGTRVTSSDVGYLAVRTVQETVTAADPLRNKIVFRNAVDFPGRSMMADNSHYTQTGYNEMGRYGSESILNSSTESWQKQAGTLYFNGSVGIGTITPQTPTSNLHLNTINVTFPFHMKSDRAGLSVAKFENINTTNNAATGTRHYINNTLRSQLLQYGTSTDFGDYAYIVTAITGPVRIGSNAGDFDIYSGVGGPTTGNTKIRMNQAGQLAIGLNPTANSSALLDLQSTTSGTLITRMTEAQRDAIVSPATGLLIYNTDDNEFNFYNGSAWTPISGSGGSTNTSIGSGYRVAVNATNNIKSISAKYGIALDSATLGEIGVTADTSTLFPAVRATIPSASTPTLQEVITAGSTFTALNTYVGGNFPQKYTFNSLEGVGDAGGAGLDLSSNSTTASGSDQTLLKAQLSGANAISSQVTYTSRFENLHTGTGSTNIAGSFYASGGTSNVAIHVPQNGGYVGLGTASPNYFLDIQEDRASAFAASITNNNSTGSGLGVNVFNTGTQSIFQLLAGAGGSDAKFGVRANGEVRFNDLPGSPGQYLTSAGAGASPTWETPSGGSVTWNAITDPTGTQALTFDDGERTTWANGSNTETFLDVTSNSLTTGKVFNLSSSSISSGIMVDIAVTGTAGLTNQTGLNISLSGANGTGAQTTYGARFSNTHTGTSVNVGAEFIASGGSTNTAIRVASGNGRVAIGQLNANASLDVVGTAILDAIQTTSVGANGNLLTGTGTGTSSSTSAPFQIEGGTTANFRLSTNGTTASTISAGSTYAAFTAASSVLTEAASGTHPIIATAAFLPPTITGGVATVTNTATVYIGAAPSATVTGANMSLWVKGLTRVDGNLNINSGVAADGGGLKHARVTTGRISAGSTALVTITWTTAFADANYSVSASVVDATTSSLSLSVVHVESVTASAVTVRVLNNAVGSLTGTVNVIAIHD
jgi:hypothetical protein